MKTFLLIGFPNSGKSTIFNLLSGESRKVSNYSGVTVDAGIAELKSNSINEEKIRIIDLPGIYNLLPSSLDEGVTVSTFLNLNNAITEFHEIILVLDSSRFEASLALALSMREIVGNNISLLINKSDLFYKKNNIDLKNLEKTLDLRILICSALKDDQNTSNEIDLFLREKKLSIPIKPKSKILLTEKSANYLMVRDNHSYINITTDEEFVLKKIQNFQIEARKIIKEATLDLNLKTVQDTYRIDKILLHPFWGGICFVGIFFLIFQSLYTVSTPIMGLIESMVKILGDYVSSILPDGLFKSLVVDGIFAGVGGVLVFLPQVGILFFLLSILEQSGYISRAAFITDRVMAYFGLNGKAFLPFLSAFACSVPAIMSTRTIEDKGERMATIMTLPLITCSARLPVYVLLIGTFIPSYQILGIFNSQAIALFFLYFLGSVLALIMAKIFRLSLFKSKSKSFFIEMPIYQKPKLKIAWKQMYSQSKVFLKKAGTTIFALSILIWFLSSFPRINENDYTGLTKERIASIQLEKSTIGTLGKAIEPVIKPLGYDWKVGVGILIAFGARELFVSGMGTMYSLGDVDENSKSLRERLKLEKNPNTGLPTFNLPVVWSLLVFFAFACQCMSTLAIVKKETQSWKWSAVMFGYMTVLAYVGAFFTNKIVTWLILT